MDGGVVGSAGGLSSPQDPTPVGGGPQVSLGDAQALGPQAQVGVGAQGQGVGEPTGDLEMVRMTLTSGH